MAVFHSKYRELSFYVKGERHSFSSGVFSTDDAEIIAVLDTLTDAQKVKTEEKASAQELQVESKPAPKSRKPSGK